MLLLALWSLQSLKPILPRSLKNLFGILTQIGLNLQIKLVRILTMNTVYSFISVQFSRSVVSNSLRPHGLQRARLPCPSPTPRVYSNSCPLSWMPSNHLILGRPLLFSPSIFPSIRVFSNESVLPIRWPKYWSFIFSISSSNEYSGLISSGLYINLDFSWKSFLGPGCSENLWNSSISPQILPDRWSIKAIWIFWNSMD